MKVNRRVTMQDVANAAHVSKTAVSMAFNNSKRLSDATVQAIHAAARELGYVKDPFARMIRTRKTNSLGLLLPQDLDWVFGNPYNSEFLQGIGQICRQEGYTLLLAPPLRGSMLRSIPYSAVDGFIVFGLEIDNGEVDALHQRGIPFVLVDSEAIPGVPRIDIDDRTAMDEIVRHVLALGHRRIAFIVMDTAIAGGYTSWRGPMQRRVQGAIDALTSVGLSMESEGISLVKAHCSRDGGAKAFDTIWDYSERPTAAMCFSDILAFGLIDQAKYRGVSIPGQLSVTGFDDVAAARISEYSLTTVRQSVSSKGRLAAEYLVEALNSGNRHLAHEQLLGTAVILRNSTGSPSAADS